MTQNASRRVFLKSSALAGVVFGAAPRSLMRSVYAAGGGTKRKTMVVIFQRGACDGLNTVIPYADPGYAKGRPTIAIPAPGGGREGAALDLDGHFGLHPALADLLPLYKEGSLGIVHAIGSPDLTRSHFDAQDFMESGTPGRKSTPDGWMNRCAGSVSASESRVLMSLPPLLQRHLGLLHDALPQRDLALLELMHLRRPARHRCGAGIRRGLRDFPARGLAVPMVVNSAAGCAVSAAGVLAHTMAPTQV